MMVDNHGSDLCYASLTLHAKPPPVAIHTQFNTNKSLWSARTNNTKDVWSPPESTEATKEESIIEHKRGLPQIPVDKDNKACQTYRKPLYRKYWMFTAFLGFVVTTSLVNILFWVLLINVRNSYKPYCRPTIVVEQKAVRPPPVYRVCQQQSLAEDIITDDYKRRGLDVKDQHDHGPIGYIHDYSSVFLNQRDCKQYGEKTQIKFKRNRFGTYSWKVCDVKIILRDGTRDEYKVMLQQNHGVSHRCWSLYSGHSKYRGYDCKGVQGIGIEISRLATYRGYSIIRTNSKITGNHGDTDTAMVICDVTVTGESVDTRQEMELRYNEYGGYDDDY